MFESKAEILRIRITIVSENSEVTLILVLIENTVGEPGKIRFVDIDDDRIAVLRQLALIEIRNVRRVLGTYIDLQPAKGNVGSICRSASHHCDGCSGSQNAPLERSTETIRMHRLYGASLSAAAAQFVDDLILTDCVVPNDLINRVHSFTPYAEIRSRRSRPILVV